MELQPFGHMIKCPKCGCKEKNVAWAAPWSGAAGSYLPERLVITCCMCSFSWAELPLDAKKQD